MEGLQHLAEEFVLNSVGNGKLMKNFSAERAEVFFRKINLTVSGKCDFGWLQERVGVNQ